MKLKFSISIIVLLVLSLFSGCTTLSLDPTAIISANMQVKAFLDKYPNAEMQVTYFSFNESKILTEEIKENCNKPSFEPKELYRFYIKDPDTNLDLVGYLDINSQNIECIKKYSQEVIKEVEPKQEKEKITKNLNQNSTENKTKEIKYEKEENSKFEFKKFNVEYDDKEFIEIEWEVTSNDNIKYFKIVRSTTNDDPKYPEDGYVKVVNPHETQEYKIELSEKDMGKIFYRITAVFNDDSKIHSPAIKLNIEKQETEPFEIELEGDYKENDDLVKLKWEVNSNDNIKYFKIVRSTTNDNPKYPEDGYVKVINPHEDKNYELELSENDNLIYYRITTVFNDDSKIHSNVLKFEKEKSEIENFEINLEGEYDTENSKIILEWKVNSNDDVKYYKIVRSYDNNNPKYPEDGYVDYIVPENSLEYRFETKEDHTGNEFWYRITTVFNDDSKHHSEVLAFIQEEETNNEENYNQTQTNSTE